jgi:hypothetical protein
VSRKAKDIPPTQPERLSVIHEHALYDLRTARLAAGVAPSCLEREIKLGRLRAAKRGGKTLILGRWLLAWVEAGAVERAAAGNGPGAEQADASVN